jgi:hypothetical protein
MDIDFPLKDLGEIDMQALSNKILSLDSEAWFDNSYRQQAYDVHTYTQSLVMVFTTGEGWPNIEVSKQSAWDLLAEEAVPLMHSVLEKHYQPGGTIIRAMAAKLVSGGTIKPHVDKHPSFHASHRIHIPITTNPRVRFMIDGKPHNFEVGKAYEINNQKRHSVMNKGKEDRITFIFDYVPPGRNQADSD